MRENINTEKVRVGKQVNVIALHFSHFINRRRKNNSAV
jgi:hypothetical protein